jgi:hypothetical protein
MGGIVFIVATGTKPNQVVVMMRESFSPRHDVSIRQLESFSTPCALSAALHLQIVHDIGRHVRPSPGMMRPSLPQVLVKGFQIRLSKPAAVRIIHIRQTPGLAASFLRRIDRVGIQQLRSNAQPQGRCKRREYLRGIVSRWRCHPNHPCHVCAGPT